MYVELLSSLGRGTDKTTSQGPSQLYFSISQDLPRVRQSVAKQAFKPMSPDRCFPALNPEKHSPRCSAACARSEKIWIHLEHVSSPPIQLDPWQN